MTAKIITALPTPYQTFESYCKIYSYIRLHAIIRPYSNGAYTYTLFRFLPYSGLYSQLCVNTDVAKAMDYLHLQQDMIRFHDRAKTSGDLFLQLLMGEYEKMLERSRAEKGRVHTGY
jgi:hypothetical protein